MYLESTHRYSNVVLTCQISSLKSDGLMSSLLLITLKHNYSDETKATKPEYLRHFLVGAIWQLLLNYFGKFNATILKL